MRGADHRERHAVRAGVGGFRDARDLEHDAAAGAHLRERGLVPDPVLPVRRDVCEVSYADRKGKYQNQQESFCRNCSSHLDLETAYRLTNGVRALEKAMKATQSQEHCVWA